MTPNRKKHLYDQYVLSIVNDGDWYRKVRGNIAGKEARCFVNNTQGLLRHIRLGLGEDGLSDESRTYVYLQAWMYHGGNAQDFLADNMYPTLKAEAEKLIAESNTPTPTEPEVTMNQSNNANAVAFETKHYVYGMDVTNMSSGQLIDAIKRIEAEIADLKGVKAKSEHLKKRITELEGMLVKVVEVLDAK